MHCNAGITRSYIRCDSNGPAVREQYRPEKVLIMISSRKYSYRVQVKTSRIAKKLSGKTPRELTLSEIRQIRNLSQQNLAASMNKKQPNVSKMERNSDMYISTLRMYIEAMGGNLEIIAKFPDGNVRINQFRD